MILVLSNSRDETANYLCSHLRRVAVDFLRLDTDRPLSDVGIHYSQPGATPTLRIGSAIGEVQDIRHVWFRRPRPLVPNAGRDQAEQRHVSGEWSEAIEGFLAHLPLRRWVNHPSSNVSASHKMEQLTRATRFGLRVPETVVTTDPDEAVDFWKRWNGSVVTKPLNSGYLERDAEADDTVIFTSSVGESDLGHIDLVRACPTLFQRRIFGLNLRITVIDDVSVAVGLKASEDLVDIRRNNMSGVEYVQMEVDKRVAKSIHELVASYGLRFAAVDCILDEEGNPFFLELNPNGQWAWLDLVGGAHIADVFTDAFQRTT